MRHETIGKLSGARCSDDGEFEKGRVSVMNRLHLFRSGKGGRNTITTPPNTTQREIVVLTGGRIQATGQPHRDGGTAHRGTGYTPCDYGCTVGKKLVLTMGTSYDKIPNVSGTGQGETPPPTAHNITPRRKER